jgi:hypothetical protein
MQIIFRFLFITVLITSAYSCKSAATIAEIDTMKRIVSAKKIKITANSATPMGFANTRGLENLLPPGSNVANINLINIQNHVLVKGDSLLIDLPYYGELQIVTAYNSDAGINFEGIPTSSKFVFNERKKLYQLDFETKLYNESLRMSITLFPNKRSSFVINSSSRTTITYDGFWKEIE